MVRLNDRTLKSKVWCYWFQREVPKQQQFNIALLKVVTDYGD